MIVLLSSTSDLLLYYSVLLFVGGLVLYALFRADRFLSNKRLYRYEQLRKSPPDFAGVEAIVGYELPAEIQSFFTEGQLSRRERVTLRGRFFVHHFIPVQPEIIEPLIDSEEPYWYPFAADGDNGIYQLHCDEASNQFLQVRHASDTVRDLNLSFSEFIRDPS